LTGRRDKAQTTGVGLEQGKTWTFAAALDWPGWCRRGKGEEAALTALADYAPRYALVAGKGFAPGDLAVAGTVAGDQTTDFGAPGTIADWDREPLTADEADRQTGLLEAAWRYFDQVAGGAPATLRKGPRGGGRDTAQIIDHVREAERTFGRRGGAKVPPRTPWPEQREAIAAVLRAKADPDARWPARYAIRRLAWHVLDHAWEIEDKSDGR
jgi:hypothetical protein